MLTGKCIAQSPSVLRDNTQMTEHVALYRNAFLTDCSKHIQSPYVADPRQAVYEPVMLHNSLNIRHNAASQIEPMVFAQALSIESAS